MGDDTYGSFHCPAQECQRDRVPPDFGDSKRFYLHWNSTHKPRCPRSECKYSLQDLRKSTESYFVRHWSTHYPNLSACKSACGKCGRQLANASNRDRHAAKCEGDTAGANWTSTAVPGHELDLKLPTGLPGRVAPELGSKEWNDITADPTFIRPLPYGVGSPSYEDLTSSVMWSGEAPFEQAFTVLMPSPQLLNPSVDPEFDLTAFEKMLASPLPWHPLPDVTQSQRMFGQSQFTNAPYAGTLPNHESENHSLRSTKMPNGTPFNSRKRATEDMMIHASKRHQSRINNIGNSSAGSKCTETYPGIAGPSNIMFAGASESTTFHESNPLLERMIQDSQLLIPGSSLLTDNNLAISTSTAASVLPQTPLKPHTRFEYISYSKTVSGSQQIEIHKRLFGVKSFFSSIGVLQETTYDHHTWVRKLTRKPRKTTDTTSLLVNNILISKKTRCPRIIDDNSPIFELCATGNYDEVNKLLSLRKATILDVDSQGRTLLHWAAAHWQLSVCQLLLAKGADAEARDWDNLFEPVNPLGIACRILSGDKQSATPNIRPNYATDTLRLLLESGLDIHASVEIDHNLLFLAGGIAHTNAPHPIKSAVAQQLSWLIRRYVTATTCDGLLPYTELHPKAFAAMRYSNICYTFSDEFWAKERPDCELLMDMDTHTFRSFWLSMIASATVYGNKVCEVSAQFCQAFAGNFHYQQSWDVDGHAGTDSPMQLALRSFAALGTFHSILMACGTDIAGFTELECTMPWCTYTQETLMKFFSLLQPQGYTHFSSLFPANYTCHQCYQRFQHKGLMNWENTIEFVGSGRSLASLLQFSSKEEEEMLSLSMRYCKTCRLDMQKSCENGDVQDDQAEGHNEYMEFIESEVDDDGGSLCDTRESGMEHEQTEKGTDADSSNESLDSEDLE